jgi:integrase
MKDGHSLGTAMNETSMNNGSHDGTSDRKARRVYLEPGTTKNDDSRWFPFTKDLRAVLNKQRETTDQLRVEKNQICPLVFHYRGGRPIGDFRKSWKTACRKAGLPGRIPHDFRRTAVRNLVRAGIPERVAMQMTGHKTRSVFERYNIVSDSDLDQAAVLLDKVSVRKI